MTDNEIIKDSQSKSNTSSEKIKAIYPHITVSGAADKPYYNIDWYDIEKQKMYRGYSSYNLQFVRKWLQENFEVIDDDIDNLINRQKAEIERLREDKEQLEVQGSETIHSLCAEIRTLEKTNKGYTEECNRLVRLIPKTRAEAVKEFAEKAVIELTANYSDKYCHWIDDTIDNLVKEMVGDSQ